MCEEIQCTPPELVKLANYAVENLIPTKSRKIYEFACERLIKWAQEQNVRNYSENVMLAYFSNLAEKHKSSTLWAQYSMLKAELNLKNNVNIAKYAKLNAFLKRQGEGYNPKKSKVLTKQEFDDFLQNAPNDTYLATKVRNLASFTNEQIGNCRSIVGYVDIRSHRRLSL